MTTLLNQLSDQHLLQRLEAGDEASFEALFQRHYRRVYGLLFRLLGSRAEAEDLTQEVFLRLHQRPPRRRDNIAAWLYRVATNLGYNAIRDRQRLWERNVHLVPPEKDERQDPQQQVAVDEEKAAVRRILAQLAPQQAQLLLLRQMGLSYSELAEACDLNPHSVGKTLSRAAAAFKRLYAENERER